MERIPQSIAKRVVFRAYLASDHVSVATGKTIAITISKNGGAFANPAAGATNATAISNGFYYFDLGTGDTGTLGPLAFRGAEGTIDDVGGVMEVVAATNAGFSALPNAAADAAGGLPISDAGGLDMDTRLNRLDAAVTTRSSHAAADVWSVATRLLTAGTNVTENLATTAHLQEVEDKVDGIKAKTDGLTFTTAGQVDANVQSINDTTLGGNGSSISPWGPV